MKHPKTITLGELRRKLAPLLAMPDDTEVYFGAGDLSWHQLKPRGPIGGPGLMQIAFTETYSLTSDPTVD